ncbi:Cna B-type domain-containing protein [Virgibacillus sp. W0181]|uniref:Cna B-type domain-containing protein n=1 Tax=Virgibacillus sp. W0181 TaxID=3391581 RepID=UPI003F475FB4
MSKKLSVLFIFLLFFQTITSGFALPGQAIAQGNTDRIITGVTVKDADVPEANDIILDEVDEGTEVYLHVNWSIGNIDLDMIKEDSLSIIDSIDDTLVIQEEQQGKLSEEEPHLGNYQATTNGIINVQIDEIAEKLEKAKVEQKNGTFIVTAIVEKKESTEGKDADKNGNKDTGKGTKESEESDSIQNENAAENINKQQDLEDEKPGADKEKDTKDPKSDEGENSAKNKGQDEDTKGEDPSEENSKNSNSIGIQSEGAKEEKQGFNLELGQVTDLKGNRYSEENLLDPKDEFRLNLNWNLEDGHSYTEGHSEIFELPKGIKIQEEINVALKDDSGLVVANAVVGTDNKVELTFTDFVETHSNVTGHMQIVSMIDKEDADVDDENIVLEPIGSEGEIRIPINRDNTDKTIEKQGTPNKGYDADEIKWEVTINKNKQSLTNAMVTDVLPEGSEYKKGSLRVTKLKADLDGNILGDLGEVDVIGETVENGTLNIPMGNIKDAYRIEYITSVTDDEQQQFKNDATLSDDGLDPVSADATITINRGDPIKKSAVTEYDPKTGIIEWELEFNFNQKELNDVTLTDAWEPKGKMHLVEDSLEFQEVTIDDDGNAHNEGEAINLPEGAELENGEDQFEIIGISTNKPYKVTYQTKVNDRVLDSFDITNTAGFGTETDVVSGTGVGAWYGSKSAGDVDYKNKTIDWKIELNHDEYPMENISIVDTLGDGLTLDKESIAITVDGQEYTGGYTVSDGNPFELAFPDDFSTDKKIVITYKTGFVADEVPNQEPTNKAAITWTPVGENDSITKEIEAGTELNDDTKNNDWKNGSYNPDTKEITWTIYTNYRENDIGDLIIKDKPQGNQTIVPGSAVVTELSIDENGNKSEDETLNAATIDEGANSLEVNIGETDKAYKIEYKTSLEGLSDIQKEYVNKAEVFDGDTLLSEIDAKVGIAKAHTYGYKSGEQEGKQVHWSVTVNPGQQKVSNLKLEDTVSENQDILTHTFNVYEASVDNDGNATKGEELSTDQYTLTHTEGEPTFTVEWEETVESAFIVEYSTLFFEKHNGEVTNSYTVSGDNIVDGGTTDGDGSVTIKQLASGGGSGTAGYLVIDKVDTTYGQAETKLQGAEFDLIDADTGNVLKSGTTDENGQIDFGRLLFGDYILHETNVPVDLVNPHDNNKETITIDKEYRDDSDKEDFEYRVENYEPVFMIELTKTNTADKTEVVPGAEYTVYKDNQGNEEVLSGTTDENGNILFDSEDLVAGTYYVKETEAPNAFQLDDEYHEVTIGEKEKEPVELNVTDKLIPGSANVVKVDAENTDTGLDGAVFEVQTRSGEHVKTLSATDENGEVNTGDLQPGDYRLVEIEAPNGFNESSTNVDFTIARSTDSNPTEITLDNIENLVKITNIELTKKDTVNGNQLLSGAEFELTYQSGDYALEGSPKTGTTDENGMVTFENLKPGIYNIKETGTPAGYISNSDSFTVDVTLDDVENSTIVTKDVENDPLANIIVEKVDSETNVPLNGAEFKVTKDGEDVTGYTGLTTDADGKISITGLEPGTYNLVETKAPTGYTINEEKELGEFTVPEAELTNPETEKIEFTGDSAFENDIVKGSVEFQKVDEDGNSLIEGVEFSLTSTSLENSDETVEKTGITPDENGKVSVDNLRPGDYVFKETSVPEGYQENHIMNKPIEFTVDLKDEKHEVNLDHVNNYKLVDIPVKKTWNDHGVNVLRPDVTVNLYRQVTGAHDKESAGTVTLKSEHYFTHTSEWSYTFEGLDAVDENGNEYTYTVEEVQPDRYKQEDLTGTMETGFNITNVQTTDIEVVKEWKDENSSDRPDEGIAVQLSRVTPDKAGSVEEEVETKTIKSEDSWKHTFENLPMYDEEGYQYEYDIEEINEVEGYKQDPIERDGNKFTITNVRSGKKSIEITKEWNDTEDTADRPDNITIDLFQKKSATNEYPSTAKNTKTIEPDKEGNWTHTFEGLEAFDEDGIAYDYKIEERDVPGYAKDVSDVDENGNVTITNTRTGKTTVAGEKIWKDDNKEDRPDEINVVLSPGVDSYDNTITVTEGDNWEYEFTDLPKYDDNGAEIAYSVSENMDEKTKEKYESTPGNGYDIINTRVGTIDLNVAKKWLDEDINDRPDKITLQLYQNNVHLESEDKDITAEDDWKHTFTDLDEYDDDGKAYNYTVKEVIPDGYGYEQVNNEETANGIEITNVRSEKTEIEVTKEWVDTDETKDRPSSITVELYQNEGDKNPLHTKVIKPDDEGNWTHTFTGLEKFDEDGKAYDYKVVEQSVPGYDKDVSDVDKNGNVTITNTRDGIVEIAGEKEWKDDNADDRPIEITAKLLQNGKEIDSKTVSKDDDWKYDFGAQPEFDEEGKAYEYKVEEKMDNETKEKYESTSGEGYDIINTRVGTTSVEGVKTWKDDDPSDRPDEIQINLLQNGDKIDHKIIAKDEEQNEQEYHFTDLEKYDENGVAYKYTIDEEAVEGYEKHIDGYDITNTRSEKTSFNVEKKWLDDNNATEKRPNNITVELFRSDDTDNAIKTKVIRDSDDWKYTFKNLEKYDDEGKLYTYSVEEVSVDWYEPTQKETEDGVKITNVRKGETSVEVIKDWNDNHAIENRPESVTVELVRKDKDENEKVVDKHDIKVNSKGIWSHTFDELAAFDDDGVAYKYTVREETVTGYQQESMEKTSKGYKITNVATTDLEINKTWLDDDSKDRPSEIEVELSRSVVDGEKELVGEHEVTANKDWSLVIEDLPVFNKDGKAYTYEMKELKVDGYESSIEETKNGFDIENLRVGTTAVDITKLWKDEDKADRPNTIKVNLFQDGVFYKEYGVAAEDGWKKTITDLPKYDEEGKSYTYTVTEQEVAGYASEVDGFEITNTRAETKDIEITKTWLDTEESADRPNTINVELVRTVADGEKETVDTYDVTGPADATNWSLKVEDLPAFDKNGKAYTYEIEEQEVDGYETKINGFDITNLRVDTTEISGEKTWKDEDENDRPKEITVQVKNGDTVVKEETVKADDGKWTYTFTDLAKYDDKGKEINYTIDEVEVDGYEKSIKGNNMINTRAGTKDIEITKTWLDTKDTAERPDSIEAELFRSVTDSDDKEYVKTYTIKSENGWSLNVEDLPAFDKNGKAYTYEIEEKEVEGYESTEKLIDGGFKITNLRVGKTEVTGTKTWLDDDSEDRPKSIKVNLTRKVNGELDKTFTETKTVKADKDENWSYAFTDLEKFDGNGVAYEYIVTEDVPDGYDYLVDEEYNITNLRVGKTEVNVTKLWEDEGESDRPDTIKVNLLQNGDFYKEYKITKENNWERALTNLPKYDEVGKAYEYTIKEHDVPGYASDVDGFEITNTRADVKAIEITKTWLDDDSEDRPKAIDVELFRSISNGDQELVDTITITKEADWSHEVTDLPAFDEDGKAYTYEIKEKAIDGYETTVNGFELTNLRVGETEVAGAKNWKDDNSKDRPESITVHLLQNGEEIDTKEVTEETDWNYSFTDLDKYDEKGGAYEYTVEEEPVEGYESNVVGYDITNVRVEVTAVEGEKIWKHDESKDRPDSITVLLLANGQQVERLEVTADMDWTYSFAELPAYDEAGKEIDYSVEEVEVPGYKTQIEGYNIINTLIPGEPADLEKPSESHKPGDENDPGEDGKQLPKTATNIYSFLLIGSLLLIAGLTVLYVRKKSAHSEE